MPQYAMSISHIGYKVNTLFQSPKCNPYRTGRQFGGKQMFSTIEPNPITHTCMGTRSALDLVALFETIDDRALCILFIRGIGKLLVLLS